MANGWLVFRGTRCCRRAAECNKCFLFVAARGSDGSFAFSIVASFLCEHDNSRTAALSLMKFCTNMYFGNLYNPIEFQGQKSWSHGCFCVFLACMILLEPVGLDSRNVIC